MGPRRRATRTVARFVSRVAPVGFRDRAETPQQIAFDFPDLSQVAPTLRRRVPESDCGNVFQERRAGDSNPQPLAGHLISSQAASQFAYPPLSVCLLKSICQSLQCTSGQNVGQYSCNRFGSENRYKPYLPSLVSGMTTRGVLRGRHWCWL